MQKVVRFGVSIEESLLKKFDHFIKEKAYTNRSEAIRSLIRQNLIEKEWREKGVVAGGIALVYNHHKRELVNKLMDIQHDFPHIVISTQHIHLDHENCLEIVVVKGEAVEVEKLANRLGSIKGVKHSVLAKTTTGKEIS